MEAHDANNESGDAWYVLYTNARQEARAASNLEAWGIETFHPRYAVRERGEFGKKTCTIKPLFPRYIFARFDVSTHRHKVAYTRGVQSVVSFGTSPSQVDAEIVALIKSRVGPDGLVRMRSEQVEALHPGDEVIVESSPIGRFVGVFERHANDSDRVSLLLTTVGFQCRIEVQREFVKRIA